MCALVACANAENTSILGRSETKRSAKSKELVNNHYYPSIDYCKYVHSKNVFHDERRSSLFRRTLKSVLIMSILFFPMVRTDTHNQCLKVQLECLTLL